ncbi:MAG: hypothetical protein WC289_05245 [Patescibacteria group bacterium]|jgi:arginine decarboxylase
MNNQNTSPETPNRKTPQNGKSNGEEVPSVPKVRIPTPLDVKTEVGKYNSLQIRKQKKFWKLGNVKYSTDVFDIDKDGELIVQEGNYTYNVHELVKKYGSALELFFPFIAKNRLDDLISIFNFYIKIFRYKGKFFYHYPMKVNQNKEFILPLVGEGANLEVASYNELYLVKRMWEQENFNPKIKVLCNGPKNEKYLQLIDELRKNSLEIIPIIEDMHEYELLKNFRGDVGVRVDLDVEVDSHWDKGINRFGLLPKEILKLGRIRNLKILHYHMGSQIEQASHILEAVKKGIQFYYRLQKINPTLDTIDIGGGMSIPYERKRVISVDNLVRKMIKSLLHFCDAKKMNHPNIICEWGRYIIAPSQLTVFKVLSSKDIPKGNARKWYIIDGSFMNDLLDTWAIHQKWHVVPVNRLNAHKFDRCWFAGLSCDSDDKYIAHGAYVMLPRLEDVPENESLYIAFLDTGAYQDALASHHCLLSSPAKITLSSGESRIIRRHETPEDVGKLFGW